MAEDLIWEGNIQLLEHEQRALVQPNFDRLSCRFARLFSIGSALSFEVRGVRQEASYFTSFYLYSMGRGIPQVLRARAWPRMTRYDDRWRWIVTSIVPRFRKLEADVPLVNAGLRRIFDEARNYGSIPCVLPGSPQGAHATDAHRPPGSEDALGGDGVRRGHDPLHASPPGGRPSRSVRSRPRSCRPPSAVRTASRHRVESPRRSRRPDTTRAVTSTRGCPSRRRTSTHAEAAARRT